MKKIIDEEESLVEKQRKKNRAKIFNKKRVIIALLIMGAAIGVLFTPIFNLKKVIISGNQRISEEAIIAAGNLVCGKNLFTFNLNKVGDGISKMPYINSLTVKRILPDKIEIEVKEAVPAAYIPVTDGYVVVDLGGKVLEAVSETYIYPIPVIESIKLNNYTLGKSFFENNEEKFKKTLEIIRNLYNNRFIGKVKSVSVSGEKIILKINDELIVNMGSAEQLGAKTAMVKGVIEKLPFDAKGVIDATNADKVYYEEVSAEPKDNGNNTEDSENDNQENDSQEGAQPEKTDNAEKDGNVN